MSRNALVGLALLAAACTVRVEGEAEERARLAAAGRGFAPVLAQRPWPVLAEASPLADYLAFAELGSGELEAAWQRWAAALEQVPQAATQPTTAMVGLEHRLDGGAALDRTGLVLMSDAMNNLLLPGRLEALGVAALQAARARAAEFDAVRLRLQRQVTEAFLALAERDAELRLLERMRSVLATVVPSARARLQAGGASQSDLLQAEVALDRLDAELQGLQAGRPALLAVLGQRIGTRLAAATPALPELAPLREAEEASVGAALQRNPILRQRQREVAAALAEHEVAEWARLPGFSLRSLLMGDGMATLGAAVTLPFLRESAIDAAIRQAAASVRAAEAMQRQAANDAVAATVSACAEIRAAGRQGEVLSVRLLPHLRRAADVERVRWAAGGGAYATWAGVLLATLETERELVRLRARQHVARARLQEALGGLAEPSP
ncbi:MAG: TolC family protein [Planctomycetota bacterium]